MGWVSLRVELARRRLSARGLTQLELAEACAVDLRTVQRWLAGKRLHRDDAQRVARALELGTAELCNEDTEPPSAGALAKMRAVQRALIGRDASVAQLLRMIPKRYPQYVDGVLYVEHPAHGHVYPMPVQGDAVRGFVGMDVQPRTAGVCIQLLERLLPAVLIDRARVRTEGDVAWLVERFETRSMCAPRRPDGGFTLWFWVGDQTRELLLVADGELTVRLLPGPARTELDLASPELGHALCVRPGVSQLVEAGLPRGYDRVAHRDPARIDLAVPDHV